MKHELLELMNNRLLLPLLMLSLTLAACAPTAGGSPRNDLANRPINVVATVGMIADAVKNVGGERVNVTALMGPGVDPHLYKPTASDVQKLESADIIFYGGLELEGRMTDTFVKLARAGKPTFSVSEDIDPARLRQPIEFEGKYDPHIWFDVTLWQEAVRKINKELAALDPGSRDLYQRNTDAYLKQLDELHQYVKTQIAGLPESSRVLITAHDAFGYFGAQYGMEVRGLQGTSTATEAGAKDVQDLAAFICERGIKAIFVESSVPQATIEAVQAAAQARGCRVAIGGQLFSDAMGSEGTPEGTYIGMVRHNVDTIVKALR
ncbi:MAG: zinc ABC transporter substrate-binding protein, partial [Anaerolineales bacterium]|nr:zinc ABC transporter substrate-binding protein [Anaerolineales bacterium]